MLQPPIALLNPVVEWVARRRASLHTKLLVGFLAVVLLLFSLMAALVYSTQRMQERTLHVARLAEEVARAGRMEYAITAQMHFRAMHLLTGDESNDKKLVGARQDFSTHLGYLEGIQDGPAPAVLARLRQENVPFQLSGQRVDRLAQSGNLSAAMKVHLEEEHPLSHVLEGLARDVIKAAETRRAASLQELEAERRQWYGVAAGVGLAGLALALFLGYVLSWPLLAAVGRLDEHMTRVTRGDFTQEVSIPNGDEMQGLAVKANEMMRELGRARAALLEQNSALLVQTTRVQDMNRRLEEQVRVQTSRRPAAPPDPDVTLPRSVSPPEGVGRAARGSGPPTVHPAGVYRCQMCGVTGRLSREVPGEIRCPKCKGSQLVFVAAASAPAR
jgi:HAMP domain-containing protein